jgi:hypothetical protein
LQALEADSAASVLIGPFVLVGIGLGPVMTSTSDATVGQRTRRRRRHIAGGPQSAALQLGGVIGTAVLGSVLTSRIDSVLVDQGAPRPVANQLEAAKEYVGQGIARPCPVPDGPEATGSAPWKPPPSRTPGCSTAPR